MPNHNFYKQIPYSSPNIDWLIFNHTNKRTPRNALDVVGAEAPRLVSDRFTLSPTGYPAPIAQRHFSWSTPLGLGIGLVVSISNLDHLTELLATAEVGSRVSSDPEHGIVWVSEVVISVRANIAKPISEVDKCMRI